MSLIGVSRYLEEQTRLNDEVSLTYYDTALVDQFDSSDYSFQVYSNTSLLRSIIEEYSNLGIISISGVLPGITVPCCHYVFGLCSCWIEKLNLYLRNACFKYFLMQPH